MAPASWTAAAYAEGTLQRVFVAQVSTRPTTIGFAKDSAAQRTVNRKMLNFFICGHCTTSNGMKSTGTPFCYNMGHGTERDCEGGL